MARIARNPNMKFKKRPFSSRLIFSLKDAESHPLLTQNAFSLSTKALHWAGRRTTNQSQTQLRTVMMARSASLVCMSRFSVNANHGLGAVKSQECHTRQNVEGKAPCWVAADVRRLTSSQADTAG